MSAPTLDKRPAPPTSDPTPPRRRPLFLLVASALVVVATAIGTSVALANRPLERPASTQEGVTAVAPTPGQPQTPTPEPPAKPQPTADPTSGPTADKAPILADGRHDAYVTKVGRESIVVDVVQVFTDDAAVKAAIQDGRSRDDARYLTTYVRNQNDRLRTLPLAGNLRIQLRDACGDPSHDRDALLTKLAANARLGVYYYTLTVADGEVRRIQEHLAVNAC